VSLPPGARVLGRVGGGDINEAYRVVLADGSEAFVKTRPDAAEGEYEAEAAGLRWLAEPGAVRVPRVLEIGPDYLALEWVQSGALSGEGEEELGRGLAATHAAGAPVFGLKDGARAARFGSLGLPNDPRADWASFYAESRLRPLARHGSERGALTPDGVAAVERVCERMPDLAGPPEPPARLHGDLWWGNVIGGPDGRGWLIDPSAYGGHREVDLAMLRLFGGPSARFFASYEEIAPLKDGWRERVELYQLAPLLVHALLFGGGYRASAERVARHYAG
jgi:fructosamine-3-kinase